MGVGLLNSTDADAVAVDVPDRGFVNVANLVAVDLVRQFSEDAGDFAAILKGRIVAFNGDGECHGR